MNLLQWIISGLLEILLGIFSDVAIGIIRKVLNLLPQFQPSMDIISNLFGGSDTYNKIVSIIQTIAFILMAVVFFFTLFLTIFGGIMDRKSTVIGTLFKGILAGIFIWTLASTSIINWATTKVAQPVWKEIESQLGINAKTGMLNIPNFLEEEEPDIGSLNGTSTNTQKPSNAINVTGVIGLSKTNDLIKSALKIGSEAETLNTNNVMQKYFPDEEKPWYTSSGQYYDRRDGVIRNFATEIKGISDISFCSIFSASYDSDLDIVTYYLNGEKQRSMPCHSQSEFENIVITTIFRDSNGAIANDILYWSALSDTASIAALAQQMIYDATQMPEWLVELGGLVSPGSIEAYNNLTGHVSFPKLLRLIIILLLRFAILYQFLKLAVEIAQHYMIMASLAVFSPISFAFFVSSDTMMTFTAYWKFFFTETGLFIVNKLWVYLTFLMFVKASPTLITYLAVFAFLKIGTKLSDVARTLNLTTSSMGGALLDSIAVTGGTLAMGARMLARGTGKVATNVGALTGFTPAVAAGNALLGKGISREAIARTASDSAGGRLRERMTRNSPHSNLTGSKMRLLDGQFKNGGFAGLGTDALRTFNDLNAAGKREYLNHVTKSDFMQPLTQSLANRGYGISLTGYNTRTGFEAKLLDKNGNIIGQGSIGDIVDKSGRSTVVPFETAQGDSKFFNIDKQTSSLAQGESIAFDHAPDGLTTAELKTGIDVDAMTRGMPEEDKAALDWESGNIRILSLGNDGFALQKCDPGKTYTAINMTDENGNPISQEYNGNELTAEGIKNFVSSPNRQDVSNIQIADDKQSATYSYKAFGGELMNGSVSLSEQHTAPSDWSTVSIQDSKGNLTYRSQALADMNYQGAYIEGVFADGQLATNKEFIESLFNPIGHTINGKTTVGNGIAGIAAHLGYKDVRDIRINAEGTGAAFQYTDQDTGKAKEGYINFSIDRIATASENMRNVHTVQGNCQTGTFVIGNTPMKENKNGNSFTSGEDPEARIEINKRRNQYTENIDQSEKKPHSRATKKRRRFTEENNT